MNQLIQFKTTTLSFLIAFLLTYVVLLPKVQALAPPPDGGYPGANTAEGDGALKSVTPQARGSGANNTALGYHTLFSDTTGSFNTATGSVALANNNGSANTANGYQALAHNTNGGGNTATGSRALSSNTDGLGNTAVGYQAAFSNVGDVIHFAVNDFFGGRYNTAIGFEALLNNVNGSDNTAVGSKALTNNLANPPLYPGPLGSQSTAVGSEALYSNTDGDGNTAVGAQALYTNTTGGYNIALGPFAGYNTTGSFNIDIGNEGIAGESRTIRIGTEGDHTATLIAGIWGTPIVGGATVVVNGNGQLGIAAIASSVPGSRSTRRLKQEILRDEAMNTKLRSDFLKEHRKVEEQQATITELKKEMKAIVVRVNEQESRIQRVSAELELRKAAPQMVVDNSVKTQD
jgi:hypothetical protein